MCTFINQMFTGEGDLRGNFVTYQYNAPHIHSASEKGRGCLVSTVINYYTTLRCSVLPTLQNMNWKEYPFVYYSSHSSPHTHTYSPIGYSSFHSKFFKSQNETREYAIIMVFIGFDSKQTTKNIPSFECFMHWNLILFYFYWFTGTI